MEQISEKVMVEFLTHLSHMNPIEFLGVATLLEVECFEDEKREIPRKVEDLMGEIIDAFILLGRNERRKLLRQMKKAAGAKWAQQ